MNTRQKWLALALLATLAAVFWPERQEPVDNVVEAVRRTPGQGSQLVAPGGAQTMRENGAASGSRRAAMQADLFPQQSWVPPPPPHKAYVPPPPPPPMPPPLPFSYLGRWMDSGRETVFLVQGDRSFPIQVGQVLAGDWRVMDGITRGMVTFTYLPLDMQSTLGITP